MLTLIHLCCQVKMISDKNFFVSVYTFRLMMRKKKVLIDEKLLIWNWWFLKTCWWVMLMITKKVISKSDHCDINLLETKKWGVKIENEKQKLVAAKWGGVKMRRRVVVVVVGWQNSPKRQITIKTPFREVLKYRTTKMYNSQAWLWHNTVLPEG